MSALVADVVAFNSQFNRDSFLGSLINVMSIIPDHRPKDLAKKIAPKCCVLYFPVFRDWLPGFPRVGGESATYCTHRIVEIDILRSLISPRGCSTSSLETVLPAVSALATSTRPTTLDAGESVQQDPGPATETASTSFCLQSTHAGESEISLPLLRPVSSVHADLAGEGHQEKRRPSGQGRKDASDPLHVIWPHRWEHDKNPEEFFAALFQLQELGLSFHVSVVVSLFYLVEDAWLICIFLFCVIWFQGQTFSEIPPIFEEARIKLQAHVKHWGYQSRENYLLALEEADVIVSTAQHEFFGVSMMEGVAASCFPLCPGRLVYPELFPKDCLYNTLPQLVKRLRTFCERPALARRRPNPPAPNPNAYSWPALRSAYMTALLVDAASDRKET
eukprot:m.189889 g.189889  ORF g.189889 m.189889 type:complete len:390 (-) comp53616_c0_seq22:16-1185(-)